MEINETSNPRAVTNSQLLWPSLELGQSLPKHMQWRFPPSWRVPIRQYGSRAAQCSGGSNDVGNSCLEHLNMYRYPNMFATRSATEDPFVQFQSTQDTRTRLEVPAVPSPLRDILDRCQTSLPAQGRGHVLGSTGRMFLVSLTGNRRRTPKSSVALPRLPSGLSPARPSVTGVIPEEIVHEVESTSRAVPRTTCNGWCYHQTGIPSTLPEVGLTHKVISVRYTPTIPLVIPKIHPT